MNRPAGALLVAGVFMLSAIHAPAEPQYPSPRGFVNDFAGILDASTTARLDARLRDFQKTTTIEVAVVTVPSLQELTVEDYTNALARKWGVGNKKKDNGVVFLVAPQERKTRVEVGYGLESRLTDIQAKAIIENAIVPLFKAGRMADGIVAGTEQILAVLGGAAAPSRSPPAGGQGGFLLAALSILFLYMVLILIINATQRVLKRSRWSSRSGWGSGGWGSSGSSWGSSGGSSGSSGGGSFGGGSFGGGGASGSW